MHGMMTGRSGLAAGLAGAAKVSSILCLSTTTLMRFSLQNGVRGSARVLGTTNERLNLAQRNYQVPLKEMNFLINDVHDFQKHYAKLENCTGAEFADEEMVRAICENMAQFSEETLAPLNETADNEGCTYISESEIKTPTGFKEAYDTYTEGAWQGISFPEEYGGQGMPASLGLFTSEMNATANFAWTMFPGLSKGAINTIMFNGSEELKEKYLHQLISGEWTGTMCLTEPQCGSDLAQVKTKAVPQGDGSYKITGTKIFISCGDHDMTDNIVHCVLARMPDAPEGTRGISLFLVPKRTVGAEGALGDLNGCNIGRIEDKMGCHGSPTCEINFDEAEGFLIGTENRGLNHMFTFINTSRVGTAMQGVAAAERSFQQALAYATERLAMRSLTGVKNPDGPADPIIVHPDVRKMLLTQKCIAEGGRSMIYECAKLIDLMQDAQHAGDEKLAKHYDEEMGFLTPILKGFLTEKGLEAANLGVQIYGGHGYIKSNQMEQIVRDIRIGTIWEGTTGIQV
jgi:alkylation response protein AidB-like acyl-CoA dehydrogenase